MRHGAWFRDVSWLSTIDAWISAGELRHSVVFRAGVPIDSPLTTNLVVQGEALHSYTLRRSIAAIPLPIRGQFSLHSIPVWPEHP